MGNSNSSTAKAGGGLGFGERVAIDGWNLVTILFGTPTCIPWLLVTLYYHKQVLYVLFTLVWIGYLVYIAWQYFSDAAKTAPETRITGDPGPMNDFYIMNMIVLSIYSVIGIMGSFRPDKVNSYRSSAKGYMQRRY